MLWGEDFDAVAAIIFVGELRQLGYRVKIVGLNMRQTTGRYGLTLVPDTTLEQALRLVEHTRCVILPCSLATVQQFSYDPRLAEFCQRAIANGALFLACSPEATHPAAGLLAAYLTSLEPVMVYPDVNELVAFVRTGLIALLQAASNP